MLNKIASQFKETLERILHYFLCIEKETFFPKLSTILKAEFENKAAHGCGIRR